MNHNLSKDDIKNMLFQSGNSNEEENTLFCNILFNEFENKNSLSEYFNDDAEFDDVSDKNTSPNIIDILLQIPSPDGVRYNQSTPFFEPPDMPVQKKEDNLIRHHVDFHHYTKLGTRQVMQRMLLNLNPNKKHTLKIEVGKGLHSKSGQTVLDNVVKSVFRDLQLPEPGINPKNAGYLAITIDIQKEKPSS